jgi:ABC-2 type transport system permease protein
MFLSGTPDIVSGASQKRENRNRSMSSMTTVASTSDVRRASSGGTRGIWTTLLLPALSLWQREILRFYRMKSRVVGVIASPILFWLVIGSGFGHSVNAGRAPGYLAYFFPGAVIMIVLFTAIFTMMSVIEDRREGFLLSVLVSPASRSAIVLGKVLGGATLATLQGLVLLIFAPLIGARMGMGAWGIALLAIFLVSFSLTALGFIIAWRLDSTQAFHAIVNLFLIPLWLISGALFPIAGASGWMRALMLANPLTYGVEALRMAVFSLAANDTSASLTFSLAVLGGFTLLMFAGALVIASRRRTLPA